MRNPTPRAFLAYIAEVYRTEAEKKADRAFMLSWTLGCVILVPMALYLLIALFEAMHVVCAGCHYPA